MRVRQSRLFRTTASVTLVLCIWMSGGGQAWAELRAAERAPAEAIARVAEDPRLPLSPEERGALKEAATQLAADLATPAGMSSASAPVATRAVTTAESDPAAEMQEIARQLDQMRGSAAMARAGASASNAPTLADLKGRWRRVHQQVIDEFTASRARLQAARASDVILRRHAEALAAYRDQARAVTEGLEAASAQGLAAAADRLRTSSADRPQQSLDPRRLPFRGATPTRRKPGADTTASGARSAGAAVGGLVAAAAVEPPSSADLSPTEDAPITPEIQALAASLGNQPLPIFNWVRNNVEFVPTYGSVQGAAMTLEARRGNAFDVASLLIALLRAAGVHARYVTGTVEVPVAAVMSWVGGAASPREAQQLLGQGGIPTVALVSGGTITHIRLDHVWVSAFIDYIPSRGAVHRTGDTWVPMDASFKLHDIAPRSPMFAANPITSIVSPGTRFFDFDEALGKATNVDEDVLNEALQGWVAGNDQFMLDRRVPRTVNSVVGGPTVRPETRTVFPASLPYRVVNGAVPVADLPAGFRHYVRVDGYSSELSRAFGDTSFSLRLSLPELNSRRLSIQFEPSTQADADVLAAARASNAPSLPVYVVNVTPIVRLDGASRATGAPVRMGSGVPIDVILEGPDGPTTVSYTQVAGDEIVVGVTGNGVSQAALEKRFAANPVNDAPEYLHEVQMHYWFECDQLGEVAARGLGVHTLRLPSVGLFNSPLTVSYLFGTPRSGVYQSRIMDVKQSLLGVSGDDPARVLTFFKQAGLQSSYLEGSVFDQLEGRPQNETSIRGISAVHLISTAIKQGIPLYHVTAANVAAVLPLLAVDASVKSDISRAVTQGQSALVPERNLTLGPWRGIGYIVRDDATGAGGYLISGGLAGGGLIECLLRKLVPVFRTVLIILAIIAAIILLAMLLAALWELAPVLVLAAAFAPAAAVASPQTGKEDIASLLLVARGLAPLSVGPASP